MAVRLAELAVRYGCEVQGDPDLEVSSVATLAQAGEGSIAFLSNPAYKKYLADTKATAVILDPAAAESCPVACLINENPYATYALVATELHPVPPAKPGISASAQVGEGTDVPASCHIGSGVVLGKNVQLGDRVFIGPNCVINDDCSVASDSRLVANVSVYPDVHIGERCVVHAGCVLGADGFGIAQSPQGWLKVPQLGGVRIGDDVELGALCTIDRGAIEDTIVSSGVKLDDHVHIAHNAIVGSHTVIAAQSGISGSSKVGARCVIGGRTAIAGHLEIVDDVYLMGRSSVTKSISEPGTYSSAFSVEEAGKWRKLAARFKRLEVMARQVKDLERKVNGKQD